MDFNKACEVLGVKEDSSRDEIERRYSVILKKRKTAQAEEDSDVLKEIDIGQVTEAYNLLMGYEEPKTVEVPSKANPILKKAGLDEKKVRNFWDYYKFHVIGGLVLLIVLVFSLKSCITAQRPDFNFAYIGNIYASDTDLLKANIKKAVPQIKLAGIDGATLSSDNDAQQQYAMQMKTMILLAAADVDLIIVDRAAFNTYAKDGAYLRLDDYVNELGLNTNTDSKKLFRLTPKDEKNEGLYGIDVSNSKLLKESNVRGKEFVAAIPVRSKHIDTAVKLIKAIMAE